MPRTWFSACAIALFMSGGPALAADKTTDYLPTVRAFADNVLKHGRDTYGEPRTPLLVDGINVDTHEPPIWKLSEQHQKEWKMPARWVISNLASQQTLFRLFVVLSDLTGDPKYKQAAVEATRYMFEHYQQPNGLIFWGGHAAVDLVSKKVVGEAYTKDVPGRHELKSTYPFYDLMWEVNPQATQRFIESFWSNHILDWKILDMNRHGKVDPISPTLWQDEYVGGPLPFVGKGLTFSNTGSDLYYAGALLSQLSGNELPMVWAKRMAQRYVDVRDAKTGLGADNYSTEPTNRMKQQFGPEFGDRFTEATITAIYGTRYTRAAICQFKLAERLGAAGEDFKRWAFEDLTAYAKHCYDPTDNRFWATLIDGTRLSPADRKRDGYVEVRWLEKKPAGDQHFWAYGLAYRHTRDALMWTMVSRIAKGLDLGDLGTPDGAGRKLNLETQTASAETIFALLDLYFATRDRQMLALARRIGDNLVKREFHKGFFVPSAEHLYCHFDTNTPLALTYLEIAEKGLPITLPLYAGSHPYLHSYYEGTRTYDNSAIYAQKRSTTN